MPTLRQIEADRRNAQKSTGPTSVSGKAVSSMNALKTGIHAKSLVLPSEKLADLDQLIADFYHHHNPATPEARALLDDLIRCEWTLRRLHVAEAELWAFAHKKAFTPDHEFPLGQAVNIHSRTFSQIQWRIDSTRRASLRALQTLRQLEAEAQAQTRVEVKPAPPIEPDPPALLPPSLPRSPQTTSPQIGFVPQTPVPNPPPPPVGTAYPQARIAGPLASSLTLMSRTAPGFHPSAATCYKRDWHLE